MSQPTWMYLSIDLQFEENLSIDVVNTIRDMIEGRINAEYDITPGGVFTPIYCLANLDDVCGDEPETEGA